MTVETLQRLLVCPVCHGPLAFEEESIRCRKCQEKYPVRAGVPVLIAPASPFRLPTSGPPQASRRGLLPPRLRQFIRPVLEFNPPLTRWLDVTLFDHLNACPPETRILNLGSGAGLFDDYLSPHLIHRINLDVAVRRQVDVLADAHWLPFADNTLDAVFSNAVLEHVERPWLVADEIHRVLRPGGKVFINVPFLNIIHDTYDYFRFTDRGLEVLFARFRRISGGISGGPSSFLGPFLVEYLQYFIPGRYAKALARPLIRLLAWPIKYLDFAIRRSQNLRVTADAFYFVGEKPN